MQLALPLNAAQFMRLAGANVSSGTESQSINLEAIYLNDVARFGPDL